MTVRTALLKSRMGQVAAVLLVLIACTAAFFSIKSMFGSPTVSAERDRIFICSQTGKSFTHELQIGETIPVYSPYSGTNTGYPAELCYWTKDGKPKDDPTPVLLNTWIHKPEPTFCPDCGRLVVLDNPAPLPGSKPPPTQEEWDIRHHKQ